ncbi:MAG: hypothetical protein ACR2NH_10645 [Solirubrobacteraceae bacterium]
MTKRLAAATALLALALPGCGGDEAKRSVDGATLRKTGATWRKLTPTEKRTAASFCMPPTFVRASPTAVAAGIDRLYAGEEGTGQRIGAACGETLSEPRVERRGRDRDASRRVARAANALILACPDDPSFLEPETVARLTKKLAVAYEESPPPGAARSSVRAAMAKLDAGCGPSARLQQALQKQSAAKPAKAPAAGGARTLTGVGPRELGDLVVLRDSDLRWVGGGEADYLSVTDDEGRLSFLSQARRGYRPLAAGTYRDVWVDTAGPWTIVLTPRYPSAAG